MPTRDLWLEIMHYGKFDRMPLIHWAGWQETVVRWEGEGLPKGVNQHQFFNAVPWCDWVGFHVGVHPGFAEEVIEEGTEPAGDYRIVRNWEGVVQKEWKTRSSIPHYIDVTFKTAADWPEYKRRLQPDPTRIPADFDQRLRAAEDSGLPVAIGTASMMGWLRNWMGVEKMCYLMCEAPDCFADVVETISDLVCWQIDQTIPRMHRAPDLGFGWEDICGKSGPLVSPRLFDAFVAPGYRKIRAKLEQYGIHLYGIDSDGMVEPLIPHWLDVGVNVQFPLEPGTWGARPEAMRKKFGRELRIVGGFNKLALEKGRAAIDAELESHVALMKEGGFVLMPDHLITPGVPLADYQYYLERVRQLRF